jgi:pimeloyl-ACP methyl ester carboxylesterase
MTSVHQVTVPHVGVVEVTVADQGQGHPFVLLHGGAGPTSVAAFADQLSGSRDARVLTPTHPGFDGTPSPAGFDGMHDLASLYSRLIDDLELRDVTVIGNSIGGWVAAEVALLANPRISGVVLVDAVGLQLDAHPIVDFFSLTMDQVADLSYANPDGFRIDVSGFSDEQRARMATNRAALQRYGGTTMADPGLLGRLGGVHVPTLVVWGAADRIVPPEHGRAYADNIPGAELVVIDKAGHLPQLEAPDQLLTRVWEFAQAHIKEAR